MATTVGVITYLMARTPANDHVVTSAGITQPTTTPPIAADIPSVNTQTVSAAAMRTKHYANQFFEFDYPSNFTVSSEHVIATHTMSSVNPGVDMFGFGRVVLTAVDLSSSGNNYVITVDSAANREHISPQKNIADAKEEFDARPDPQPQDAFQQIIVAGKPAYGQYYDSYERGNVSRPGGMNIGGVVNDLTYSIEMYWQLPGQSMVVKNDLIMTIADSLVLKGLNNSNHVDAVPTGSMTK